MRGKHHGIARPHKRMKMAVASHCTGVGAGLKSLSHNDELLNISKSIVLSPSLLSPSEGRSDRQPVL